MGIAAGMKTLSQHIIESNDMRVRTTNNIIVDTRKMLNDFSSNRKQAMEEQKKTLNNFMQNLSGKVKSLLNNFHKTRKSMGEAQVKSLSAFAKDLDKEVHSMVNGFRKDRKENAAESRKKISKEIEDIEFNVKLLKNETDNLMKEYRDDIKRAHTTWNEMSANLARSRKGNLTTVSDTGEHFSNAGEFIYKRKKKEKKQDSFQEITE